MTETYTNGRRADTYKVVGTQRDADGEQIIHHDEGGERLIKDVEYRTITCPECDGPDGEPVAAWKDENDDAICPECGMVCSGSVKLWPEDMYRGKRQTAIDWTKVLDLNEAKKAEEHAAQSD